MAQLAADRNVVNFRYPGATSVAQRLATGEALTVMDKLLFRERVDDVWLAYLDGTEANVIQYITRRTVHWGRDRFTASTENVLNGTEKYPGVRVGKTAYFSALKSLEAKGMIQRVRHKNGRVTVVINTEWTPEDQEMIPVPKRLKGEKPQEAGSRDELGQFARRTLNTDNGISNSLIGEVAADAPTPRLFTPKEKTERKPSPDENEKPCFFGAAKETRKCDTEAVQPAAIAVRQRISRVQAEMREKTEKRAEAALKRATERKAGLPTATELERVWIRALMEAHPLRLHVAWSRKEQGMVKQAQRKWAEAKTGTFAEFLDFAARNWGAVVQRKLAWMTKPAAPTYPSLDFLIWRLRDFVEVWIDRKSHVFATDADNDRYARLIAAGMGHDEAVKEIAREQAALDMRREMERREANVAKQARRAKEREERAARLEGFAERAAQLPDGSQVKVTPGTQRRPGQVWGHQPVLKVEKPEPPTPETPRPAPPPPLTDVPAMPMITETWEEARARVMAEQAAKRNKEIAAAKARMEAQPKPVLNLMITETWEEARARRAAGLPAPKGTDA